MTLVFVAVVVVFELAINSVRLKVLSNMIDLRICLRTKGENIKKSEKKWKIETLHGE